MIHLVLVYLWLCCLPFCRNFGDFCANSTKLCYGSDLHTTCLTKCFGPKCERDPAVYYIDTELQKAIVHEHNFYRSQIAMGQVGAFERAARMLQTQWDDELAYVAEFQARTCELVHDKCRNTPTYPTSGQNGIAGGPLMGACPSVKERVIHVVTQYFAEHVNSNMDLIRKYQMSPPDKQAGHFHQLIYETNNRVGCAVATHWTAAGCTLVGFCNYATTMWLDQPVYVTGEPCSQCPSGTSASADYYGLCSGAVSSTSVFGGW